MLVLATATAAAEPPKYTRKPHVDITVKASARTRPIPAKTTDRAPVSAGDVLVLEEHQDSDPQGAGASCCSS